jgi:glycosyltransferase involved in cell wall biosynthesis
MEIIIVDGYSSDGTMHIVKETLRNSDIKTRIFFEYRGLGFARQIVVDNAAGDFIIWVDGDMRLPKSFVRNQVEFMEQNPKVGIAKGRYDILKENSLVATLEDIEFLVSFGQEKEVSFEPLGASGCIYRVEAIKQAGGFDINIKGVGEDMDAEFRVKVAGWKLYISPAYFYESRRKTWQALWREYFWHGRGGFHILKKNKRILNPHRMFPPILLFKKLIQVAHAYRLTYQKKAFLLPLHYAFKRTAWFFGFMKEHFKCLNCRYC